MQIPSGGLLIELHSRFNLKRNPKRLVQMGGAEKKHTSREVDEVYAAASFPTNMILVFFYLARVLFHYSSSRSEK